MLNGHIGYRRRGEYRSARGDGSFAVREVTIARWQAGLPFRLITDVAINIAVHHVLARRDEFEKALRNSSQFCAE